MNNKINTFTQRGQNKRGIFGNEGGGGGGDTIFWVMVDNIPYFHCSQIIAAVADYSPIIMATLLVLYCIANFVVKVEKYFQSLFCP